MVSPLDYLRHAIEGLPPDLDSPALLLELNAPLVSTELVLVVEGRFRVHPNYPGE